MPPHKSSYTPIGPLEWAVKEQILGEDVHKERHRQGQNWMRLWPADAN